jgi:hypothetical protein
MTEAGIGRILVASLHQGIADLLPVRLEFYENWLNPEGLRQGTIGLAPVLAVLSFLRQEGEPYRQITRRAGECAAEWTVASQWPMHRSMIRSMPLWMRSRVVLRMARRTIRGTYGGSRAVSRVKKGQGTVEVQGSLFCNIRDSSSEQLCGFYAAIVSRFFELYSVPGMVRLDHCRAIGDPSCLIDITLDSRRMSSATSRTSPE